RVTLYPLDDVLGNSEGAEFRTLAVFRNGEAPSFAINPEAPEMRGVARIGESLFVREGTWLPITVEFSYQWVRNGVPIPGETSNSYTISAEDAGSRVAVAVQGDAPGAEPVAIMSNSFLIPYKTITGSHVEIQGGEVVG